MKLKAFATALTTMLILGCSNSDGDDWSAFEEFKIKDESGEKIDCEALVSTSVSSPIGRTDFSLYFHDYLYESEYEFSQCQAEISDYVDSYCKRSLKAAAASYMNKFSGDGPRWSYAHVCRSHLAAEFAKVSSRYELPSESSDYIIFHDAGVMLKPESIVGISFSTVVRDTLWRIILKTTKSEETVDLYFGDKDQWEQAKMDFAQTTSTTHVD